MFFMNPALIAQNFVDASTREQQRDSIVREEQLTIVKKEKKSESREGVKQELYQTKAEATSTKTHPVIEQEPRASNQSCRFLPNFSRKRSKVISPSNPDANKAAVEERFEMEKGCVIS